MSSGDRNPIQRPRDSDLAGAEAALHRAARRARERAARVAGEQIQSVETSTGTRTVDSRKDLQKLTFSQAQGYEELPCPLKLEELPTEARTHIWNVFYLCLEESREPHPYRSSPFQVVGAWAEILWAKHFVHDHRALDEWNTQFDSIRSELRHGIETLPFNKVFDLIQFVLRHRACPKEFTATMKLAFTRCRLAYTIDEGPPPTIVPAVTPEEGSAVVEALRTLRESGMGGAAAHLRNASESINTRDWAGSVRESIHAVESVARQLDPAASTTLGPALRTLQKNGSLHPALEHAFNKLYGYTSDEQGIRHALLDPSGNKVGMDEALFMLSACASFSSYLRRKHTARQAP